MQPLHGGSETERGTVFWPSVKCWQQTTDGSYSGHWLVRQTTLTFMTIFCHVYQSHKNKASPVTAETQKDI